MRRLLFILAALVAAGVLVRQTLHTPYGRTICPRCNVLLITIDNLRADALPCYGYKLNTAPHICRFADGGMIFTRAYANSSWTLPSEVSLFTGLYPTSHNIGQAMLDMLNPSVDTLPVLLKRNGYETIGVTNIQANVGLEQGLSRGFSSLRLTKNEPRDAIPIFLTAINDMKAANRIRKPVFMFFHTDGVHDYMSQLPSVPSSFPLDPQYHAPILPDTIYEFTQKTWDITYEQLLYAVNTREKHNANPQYDEWYQDLLDAKTLSQAKAVFDRLPPRDKEEILWENGNKTIRAILGDEYGPLSRHLYDEATRTTDHYLGYVFARLKEQNLLHNTIVIITSEHGEFLGEHGVFGHGQQFFDPEIHIPFILYVPGMKPGKTPHLASLVDVYATLMDLLHIKTHIPTSSVSLKGIALRQTTIPPRTFVISEWFTNTHDKSILTNSWHLLETDNATKKFTQELYLITRDPQEMHNLASQYPSVVQSLSNLLHTSLKAQPIYEKIPSTFPAWIDEEHRRKLIETGYF